MISRHRRHLTGFLCKHGCISKLEGALERSSSTVTNLPEANPSVSATQTFGPPLDNVVVTLDPSKFAEKKQRRFHIGNHLSFRPYIVLRNQLSRMIHKVYYKLPRVHPYPPDTTAFLYYFTSPKRPPIAGEIRLRVASSDDHSSFESGFDLLTLNGLQPWSRSLYQVSKFYLPLYEKLREDGLVLDNLDAFLSTLPPKIPRCQLLYTLNDTFFIDFSFTKQSLFVITEHGIEALSFHGPWVEQRLNTMAPYKGSALARFERSNLPDHKGSRTVVLRILKIITSLKCVIPMYDGHVPLPKEGELHRRSTKSVNKLHHPVWSIDIDKPKSHFVRGLQLLWDL